MRKTDLKEPETFLDKKEKTHKPFPIFLFSFYFILLIILMIGENVTAQVIIKEKVEITPQTLKALGSPSQQQHAITIDMQWDMSNREGLLRTVWLPCKDAMMAGWSAGGHLSLAIDNAQPGGYMFQVKVNLDVYEVSNVNYSIFLDGILASSGSVSLTGSSWDIPYYNINYSPPFISNYSISYKNKANMCYLDSKQISIYQSSSCPTVVSWNPSTEPLTLTIESGSEFVSFYDQQNNKLGDSYTGLFTNVSSLSIKQDSIYFGNENKPLVLSCDWAGVIQKDSSAGIVSINPDELAIRLNTYDIDTIYSCEIIYCAVSFAENAGCSALLPQDQTYTVEITNGQNNGNLINPMSGEEVKKIDAMDHWHGYAGFDYIADGNSCDSLDSVIIKVGTSFLGNKSSEKVIYIKPPPLKVIIDPPQLAAGDTADIIIKKRNPDGSLEDFPPNQEFEIAKLEGCLFGDILVGDSLNYYFADAKQPVRFVVADSLVSDSGVVKLRVGLVENYGSTNLKYNGKTLRAGKYIEEGKEEWRIELEKLFAEKRNKTQKLMSNGLSSSCYIGHFITYTSWQGDIPIGKPELKIITPTPDTTVWITAEPKMPTVICKAKLTSNYQGVVKYEWKYIVRKFYDRRDISNSSICVRISRSEFKGFSYSDLGGEITEWTVPFDKDSGYFYFKSLQPDKNKWDPLNYIYGCSGESDGWYDTNKEIFTGGEVLITLTAKDYHTGKVLATLDSVHSGKILGINPDILVIQAYANSNKIKAIMWQEGKTNHFTGIGINSKLWWPYKEEGWPLYGPPNGYGLMQLDNAPAATERQLWNWKANVEGGKQKLIATEKVSDDYIKSIGATSEEKYRMTNAFQYYNNGKKHKKYYTWGGVTLGWMPNPDRGSEYGKKVFDKYIEFGSGN